MSFSLWKNVKLGDVCKIRRGSSPRPIKDYMSHEGMPWVKISDATESNSRFINSTKEKIKLEGVEKSVVVNPGALILSNSGTAGLPKFMGITACIHDGWQYFDEFNGIRSDYLYYVLLHLRIRLLHGAYDSTMKNLTLDMVRDSKISLPPIVEQKAIAHTLSTLDDKIEVNNQINKTLENMAQAIFKQWFVDFEFPNEDGEPYKSSGGEMVETELGMIPKGWEVEEIGNISDIQNGFAFKAPEYVDEGVKVLRTLNIGNDGYFNNTDIVFLPQSYKSEKYEKYYFEEFDVALVMVGASIGKIGMILKNTAGGLQNQNMWRFRRKEKRVSQIFIYYTVKQAQNISKNWSTGSARDFYRKDSFRKIKVILPEKRIMDLFEKITKPIFQNISNHVCENDELISMRDGLLPKLMSGEIRVPLDEEGAVS